MTVGFFDGYIYTSRGPVPTPSLCHLGRHAPQFESIADADFD
jgi:hypothetical protein